MTTDIDVQMMNVKLDKVREWYAEKKPYRPPREIKSDSGEDSVDVQDIDEIKLHELKECFTLFDQNGDGFIDENDLRATFKTLGMQVDDKVLEEMMAETSKPITFDSFALMMVYKTMELEPEIVLLEALSKWDERVQGVISLERMFMHLTSYTKTALTHEEAKTALDEAPLVNRQGLKGLQSPQDSWIDYLMWIEQFAGFRKARMQNYLV